MKRTLSEGQFYKLLKEVSTEAVKQVLNEVTDFGNNLFGSASMNDAFRDDSIPTYSSEENIELIKLQNAVLKNILTGQDRTENYTKKRHDIIYLYGNIESRSEDIMRVKSFYQKYGWNVSEKEETGWSGYNKYPQVVLTITKNQN